MELVRRIVTSQGFPKEPSRGGMRSAFARSSHGRQPMMMSDLMSALGDQCDQCDQCDRRSPRGDIFFTPKADTALPQFENVLPLRALAAVAGLLRLGPGTRRRCSR
jgi:hypothetical protein